MPLIPLGDQTLSWEQPGHWDKVPISYPHWGITAHILKVRGWRANFNELPFWAAPGVAPCLHFRCWVQVTSHEAAGWQIQGMQKVRGDPVRWGCWSPCKDLGALGSYYSSGESRLLWWAGGCLSDDGNGNIWIKNSCSPEEGGLLRYCQEADTEGHQGLNFLLLCSHDLLILNEEVLHVLKIRTWEKGHISNKIRLLGVLKLMLYVEKGEVTHNPNGVFHSPEWPLDLVHNPPHTASSPSHTSDPILIHVTSIFFLGLGTCWRD